MLQEITNAILGATYASAFFLLTVTVFLRRTELHILSNNKNAVTFILRRGTFSRVVFMPDLSWDEESLHNLKINYFAQLFLGVTAQEVQV